MKKQIKKVDIKKLEDAGWSEEIIVLFEKINEIITHLNASQKKKTQE